MYQTRVWIFQKGAIAIHLKFSLSHSISCGRSSPHHCTLLLYLLVLGVHRLIVVVDDEISSSMDRNVFVKGSHGSPWQLLIELAIHQTSLQQMRCYWYRNIQTQIGTIQSQLISIISLNHIEFGVSSRLASFYPKQITTATIVGGTVSPIFTTAFPAVALE
jgi:hypothetical protein